MASLSLTPFWTSTSTLTQQAASLSSKAPGCLWYAHERCYSYHARSVAEIRRRNSIKSQNATASFQLSISLRVFFEVRRYVDILRHLFEAITEFMYECSQSAG